MMIAAGAGNRAGGDLAVNPMGREVIGIQGFQV
jgi:hypothetical protein